MLETLTTRTMFIGKRVIKCANSRMIKLITSTPYYAKQMDKSKLLIILLLVSLRNILVTNLEIGTMHLVKFYEHITVLLRFDKEYAL